MAATNPASGIVPKNAMRMLTNFTDVISVAIRQVTKIATMTTDH